MKQKECNWVIWHVHFNLVLTFIFSRDFSGGVCFWFGFCLIALHLLTVYLLIHFACTCECQSVCTRVQEEPAERREPWIPWNWKSEVIVSHRVGAGNPTWSLYKTRSILNHWTISMPAIRCFTINIILNKVLYCWQRLLVHFLCLKSCLLFRQNLKPIINQLSFSYMKS